MGRLKGKAAVASLDGFAESLRLLIERERYSLLDIGLMFEVTRERIRQLADEQGIMIGRNSPGSGGLRHYRVWDDTAHRFRPVPLGVFHRRQRAQKANARRTQWEATWKTREQHAVATLRTLAKTLGHTPTILELGRALGIDTDLPAVVVSRITKKDKRGGSVKHIWRRAGLHVRGPGMRRRAK